MTILIVDDDSAHSLILKEVLARQTTHRILIAERTVQALNLIKAVEIDLLITNYEMPENTGDWLIEQVRALKGPQLPILLISATSTLQLDQALKWGASSFLKKPVHPAEFIKVLNDLLTMPKIH